VKPAQSIMIRVGTAITGVSTVLNDFHSKTVLLTSGFYCNCTDGGQPPPPSGVSRPRMAFDQAVPPVPTSLKDRTFTIWENPFNPGSDEYPLPLDVSSTYLTITRVSGGFQVAKTSGYSGSAVVEIPSTFDLSLGHGLQTNDVVYLRVGDVLPSSTSFTWLSSASGTSPRAIVGYQSSIVRSGQFFESARGGYICVFSSTYNSTDLTIKNFPGLSIRLDPAVSPWSGSSLGGSVFEIIIMLEQTPPIVTL